MQEQYAAVREILPSWQGHGVRHIAVRFRGGNGGEITSLIVSPVDTADAIDPAEATAIVRATLDERVPYWANRADVDGWMTVHLTLAYVTLWLTRETETDTLIEQENLGDECLMPPDTCVPIVLGEAPEDPLEGARTLLPAWRASGTRGVTAEYQALGSEVTLTGSTVRPAPTAGIVRHSVVASIVCELLAGFMKRSRGKSSGAVYIDVKGGTASMFQVGHRTGDEPRRRTLAIDTGKVLLA